MTNQLQSSLQYQNIINMEEFMVDSNINTNIERVYCNYFLNIPVKMVGNIERFPETKNYAIKYLSNMLDFINSLREMINHDFRLSTDFDIVISTQTESGLDIYEFIKQLYPNRNLHQMAVCEIIGKNTGFYVRPKQSSISQQGSSQQVIIQSEEISLQSESHDSLSIVPCANINDCPVCFASLEYIRTNFFQCRHHICYSCFTNWRNRNGNESTCPLCRSRLNYM